MDLNPRRLAMARGVFHRFLAGQQQAPRNTGWQRERLAGDFGIHLGVAPLALDSGEPPQFVVQISGLAAELIQAPNALAELLADSAEKGAGSFQRFAGTLHPGIVQF